MVPLKLAILGTRGVPPRYGGFETFAAELGRRLVQRGHEVSVYCREPLIRPSATFSPTSGEKALEIPRPAKRGEGPRSGGEGQRDTWEGIQRIVLPAARHKDFETVTHASLSALDATLRDFDAVLVCNAANAFVLPILAAARIPAAINVDGIERKRRKWNLAGKAVYTIGESLSVVFARAIIADAEVIADYYHTRFGIDPVMIPYGSEMPDEAGTDVLERLGVEPQHYLLYVSRFEPENNPLEVVASYAKIADAPPLLMVGEGKYAPEIANALRQRSGDRVIVPGAIYGADYRTLQRHALVYIQATEVGGTHPALIEAMGSGGCVLANDTPENREVGGDTVGYFRFRPMETLSGTLREWLQNPEKREAMRPRARIRAAERYNWERVTDAYERLFRDFAK